MRIALLEQVVHRLDRREVQRAGIIAVGEYARRLLAHRVKVIVALTAAEGSVRF